MRSFKTLAEAMSHIADALLTKGRSVPGVRDPASIGSAFGTASRPTKELLGFSFTILDPTATLIDRPDRPINVAFAFSNLLWVISGSDLVEGIDFWNQRASQFSDDGKKIRSSLGPRLFPDQFRSAISRLREDPTTRRAFLSLISSDDLVAQTRDVPCTVGLHLVIRESHLEAVAMMRSQSALMVLPYDVSLLTALQCIAAAELGVAPGPFTHISSSLHMYDDELPLARQIAGGRIHSVSVPELPCLEDMKDLTLFEERIRGAGSDELARMADNLAAEPKTLDYRTVVQATLLHHVLWRINLVNEAQGLLRLAGRVGELGAMYSRRNTA